MGRDPGGLMELPQELLVKIADLAFGKDRFRVLRAVCPESKAAIEAAVSHIHMQGPAQGPVCFNERFTVLQR